MIGRLACWTVIVALLATPAAADSLSFDDPGMHFQAPAGWERVDLGNTSGQDQAPAAAFTYHRGQSDARSIVIRIKPFDGTLDGFVNQRRGELRQGSDTVTTFLLEQKRIALDNGMPAFLIVSASNSETGASRKSYEYLIIDGQRSIDVSYAGLSGDIDDQGGKAALSSLYVVAYPHH